MKQHRSIKQSMELLAEAYSSIYKEDANQDYTQVTNQLISNLKEEGEGDLYDWMDWLHQYMDAPAWDGHDTSAVNELIETCRELLGIDVSVSLDHDTVIYNGTVDPDDEEDGEDNAKRFTVQKNTDQMRGQFTKDKGAANVRRPQPVRNIQGIKRNSSQYQQGM